MCVCEPDICMNTDYGEVEFRMPVVDRILPANSGDATSATVCTARSTVRINHIIMPRLR